MSKTNKQTNKKLLSGGGREALRSPRPRLASWMWGLCIPEASHLLYGSAAATLKFLHLHFALLCKLCRPSCPETFPTLSPHGKEVLSQLPSF